MKFIEQIMRMIHNSLKLMKLFVNNEICMTLIKNFRHHSRAKHIDVQYHYIREQVVKRMIKLKQVETNNNVADILTKALDRTKHTELIRKLGMLERHESAPSQKVATEAGEAAEAAEAAETAEAEEAVHMALRKDVENTSLYGSDWLEES
jgi:ribosomal protein L12E/L44/L45/RPP1/RPP2